MHCSKYATRTIARGTIRRSLHSVPTLRLTTPEENGVPGLYTPQAYKTAWTDYQAHVIENLNRVSAETEYESLPLVKTIAQTARQPENASLYNFAAQAFSNHFFFDSLTVAGGEPAPSISSIPKLRHEVEQSFSSIESFEEHFQATATALLGSGWVWLVLDGAQKLRILTTYNAGTPFDFARLQQADPNTGLLPSSSSSSSAASGRDENQFALYTSMKRSYSLTPVLCCSVWEHSYLPDYGFDKAAYVKAWMQAVDWGKVQSRIEEAKK